MLNQGLKRTGAHFYGIARTAYVLFSTVSTVEQYYIYVFMKRA